MAKTLEEHVGYLTDRVKLGRYQDAVKRVVRPGHVVVDLGCGTGVLGLMALRAGARKVFFVEEGVVIEIARQTVANAGFADRSEFFQKNSYELMLPEKADVVLCDHVGYFGFDYGLLGLLADAKQRFLKPDGAVVPGQIELKIAPIESVECRKLVSQWRDGSVLEDFAWVATTAANSKHSLQSNADELLSDSAILATLQLGEDAADYLSWSAEFECVRDATLDGIAGWFECQLHDDIFMTNSPVAEERLDRPQAFLPLESPLPVSAGEKIKVTVMVRHRDHVIGWIIELPESGKRFTHNTFNGLLLDRETLLRVYPDRMAKLNDRGRARQIVLSYCDGQRTVAEVQSLVLSDHPTLFPSAQATATFVTQILSLDTGE